MNSLVHHDVLASGLIRKETVLGGLIQPSSQNDTPPQTTTRSSSTQPNRRDSNSSEDSEITRLFPKCKKSSILSNGQLKQTLVGNNALSQKLRGRGGTRFDEEGNRTLSCRDQNQNPQTVGEQHRLSQNLNQLANTDNTRRPMDLHRVHNSAHKPHKLLRSSDALISSPTDNESFLMEQQQQQHHHQQQQQQQHLQQQQSQQQNQQHHHHYHLHHREKSDRSGGGGGNSTNEPREETVNITDNLLSEVTTTPRGGASLDSDLPPLPKESRNSLGVTFKGQ
ncbi:myb-like protein P [Galendromus occidentalis]|uniref:Myb-like protein P n=1 Tax=Galendromus occidentalis TaxID=34638 RepID=A0AAJ6QYQ7_9ACAR|nr:myb-like protein P [Galendromus occidentalis]